MKLIKGRNYKLGNLPVGLFMCGDTLCLKTEYRTQSGAIEAYIVSSGEFFWGGVTGLDQLDVVVTRVYVDMSDRAPEVVDGIPYVPFPIAFHTVDVIATKNGGSELLLGRKHNANDWVFIGGFVEPTHTAEHTAAKEFHEEASVLIEDERRFNYIGSAFIDDTRYKNSCHKITTSLFTVELTDTEASMVKGGDDIAEVRWVPIEEVSDKLREQHIQLLGKYLLFKIKKS